MDTKRAKKLEAEKVAAATKRLHAILALIAEYSDADFQDMNGTLEELKTRREEKKENGES